MDLKLHASLAPIGISTYSRPGHLRQTIEALKKNRLAPMDARFRDALRVMGHARQAHNVYRTAHYP